MASRSLFPSAVMPIVATFTVAYPTMFMLGLWHEADPSAETQPRGTSIAAGALNGGWSYDITQRAFPTRTYRLDVISGRPGSQPLCVVEVKGGPKPERAIAGLGSVVHVTFEEPLQGHTTRSVAVNLSDGVDTPCAAMVENGVRLPPEAVNDQWLTIVRHGKIEREPGG